MMKLKLLISISLFILLAACQEPVSDETLALKKQEAQAYLDNNKTDPEVTTTASGLQYKVMIAAEGNKPSASDTVEVHYRGTLTNGEEFDSSYKRGKTATFPLNRVIKGWTEGVQLMSPGAKYQFTVPYHLAYGERGSRSIPPFATLIFEIELVSIQSK